jgi:hypothetical protein
VFTQYPIPIRPSGGGTGWITAGPDGALWFTVTCNQCAHDEIGRITTSGVIPMTGPRAGSQQDQTALSGPRLRALSSA